MDRKRAFGYVRVSEMRDPDKDKAEKRESKWSPESQREAIRREVERLDVPLVEIFQDLHVPSSKMEKAGTWDKLMSTVTEGDSIITVDFTRIGRNQLDTLKRIADLIDKGCEIISLEQKFDMHGVYAKAIVGFMAGVAEGNNKLHGMKISAAQREMIKAGQGTGGPLPTGYSYGERVGKRRVVEINEKSELVKEIYRLFLSGNGHVSIARILYEGGTKLSPRTIQNILRNRSYIGEQEMDGEVYPINRPPIIDRETWDRARALEVRNPKPSHPTYFLSGMMKCSLCDGLMVHKPRIKDTAPQWTCYGRRTWGSCKGVSISEHIADREVLEALFSHIEDEGYSEAVDAYEFQEKKSPELKSLRQKLNTVVKKRERVLLLFAEGRIEMAEYDRQVEPLNVTVESLEREISKVEAGVTLPPQWKGDIREDWEILTVEEKRHALNLFVEKTEVLPGPKRPGRVVITWR